MSPTRAVLVVPCYNEAQRLDREEFDRFLGRQNRVDLVFVNDGSTDGTQQLLDAIQRDHPDRTRALHLAQNSGKGEAVRQGVVQSLCGGWEYVGYWDADLATPLAVSTDWVELLDRRADIDWVFGARIRLLGRTVERDPVRHILGRVFATAASAAIRLPVYDTQCGAKLFRRTDAAAAAFSTPFISRWVFDVELLARVASEHRIRSESTMLPVCEVPLEEWRDISGSKIKLSHMLRAVLDLARIGWTVRRTPSAKRARAYEIPHTRQKTL